jgi:DNA-binding NarL/FixJ family response regulator
MRVFLVDDSEIIRQRLRRMLSRVDQVQVVGEVGSAQEAIAAIQRDKPDLVLLDIHLMGGSGIDVLEKIKGDPLAPIVIVLTNYPYPQYRARCMEAGADYFFVKSAEFEKVVPTIEQFAQQQRDSTNHESLLAPPLPQPDGEAGTQTGSPMPG